MTDVSCNAATIDAMAGRQLGIVAPQYDALRPDTDLVTITVGANDIGLGFVVPSCSWITQVGGTTSIGR
ncbi:hypothetical protein [Amycolatopsis sp. NPDC052450]|uniref:hypothetical protein n=1 Tax=Amycolatopsis sp. NPDC052450 TaxID=3363937 RepID=UPI0037C8DAFB